MFRFTIRDLLSLACWQGAAAHRIITGAAYPILLCFSAQPRRYVQKLLLPGISKPLYSESRRPQCRHPGLRRTEISLSHWSDAIQGLYDRAPVIGGLNRKHIPVFAFLTTNFISLSFGVARSKSV